MAVQFYSGSHINLIIMFITRLLHSTFCFTPHLPYRLGHFDIKTLFLQRSSYKTPTDERAVVSLGPVVRAFQGPPRPSQGHCYAPIIDGNIGPPWTPKRNLRRSWTHKSICKYHYWQIASTGTGTAIFSNGTITGSGKSHFRNSVYHSFFSFSCSCARSVINLCPLLLKIIRYAKPRGASPDL